MRSTLFWLLVLGGTVVAQEAAKPTVKFSFSNPKLTPPAFALEVDQDCRATYFTSSDGPDNQPLVEQPGDDDDDSAAPTATPPPSTAPEPAVPKKERSFPMTVALCHQIFDLAQAARYFDGDFQFKKHKVAYTGDRTLEYRAAGTDHETKYTWSENPSIQKLTAIFEGVSTTLEAAPHLNQSYRFDRLGLNEVLSHLVDMANRGWLQEIWLIEPDLKRIAADPKVMNIARQRASYLIDKAQHGSATSSDSKNRRQ